MSTLERLKELEAKATPGPWVSRVGQAGICNKYLDESIIDGAERDVMKPENVRLIVELRNALPKLLAVIEAAEEYFNDDAGEFNPKYFPKRAAVQKALKALHES